MAETLGILCTLKKVNGYSVIIPASNTDKINLSIFQNDVEDQWLKVSFSKATATKTYSQLKTAWALVTLLFRSEFGRKPTEKERQKYHLELLEAYADDSMREPSLRNPEELVPITFREMSIQQLSRFINVLIQLLAESCSLTTEDQIEAQQIFKEWEHYTSSLDQDWNDYDENGNLLDVDTWREMHTVSFASGQGGPLDLAHIVTRGADPHDKYNVWNMMMLTHEEHMDQHNIGWTEFVKKYPHLKGRVKRAEKMSGHKLLLEE